MHIAEKTVLITGANRGIGELETDDTYTRFVIAPPPNAAVIKIGWRDNPWFPEVLAK